MLSPDCRLYSYSNTQLIHNHPLRAYQDEIFVSDLEHDKKNTLPNNKKINISNKHDIIYTTDEDNNLIRKILIRPKEKDDSK